MKNLLLFVLVLCSTSVFSQQRAQISLPITWQDSSTVDYSTIPFGGTSSMLVASPTNASLLCLKITKSNAAETWAGVTLGKNTGFAANIPFSANSNQMQIRVYSPNAGMVHRLKAEDKTDPTKSVETEATSTAANTWEVLTFNFANQATGTAVINYTYNYNKLSFFPNFGINGATAGEKIVYLDQVAFGTVTKTNDLFKTGEIQLAPNPSNGNFKLVSQTLEGKNVSIQVADLAGKTVFVDQGIFSGAEKTIEAGKLSNGIYFCKIVADGNYSVKKIIIKD